MGMEESPRQSPQSSVGSFPRAAAASGIMNRHDPRRRSPQTATVAAASMRSRVRRRIRAATCDAILPIRAVRLALCPALLPNN
ncbi:hypothetical protein PVAP13_6KG286812 [Panicum virgatum]|uniref:Uncharacterized protein n=1 Tax=Panicum virgatum TaxID=38727 RepID=A0A8T0RGQ0_PANVG|nr:hypothetical protein PVAP13_6KG286812 [Panicum virgatum]